jgi:acetoin utilization protein AcuB
MYVKNRMTSNCYTVEPESTVAEALKLMESKKIRRMPVVKNGKLVGFITEQIMLKISPSMATSLSVYEVNYLLSKTRVESIMTKDVLHISPDRPLGEAALKMREKGIGGLPVVEEGQVVGIINATDIFDAFIEMSGFKEHGAGVAVE